MDIKFGLNDQVGFYWYDNENKEIFETGFIVDSFLVFEGKLENKKKINEVSFSLIGPINEQDRLSRKIDLSFDELQGVVRDTFVFEKTKTNFNFLKKKETEDLFFTIYSYVNQAYYIVMEGNLKKLQRNEDEDDEDDVAEKMEEIDDTMTLAKRFFTELKKRNIKSIIVLVKTHGKILLTKDSDLKPQEFEMPNLNLIQIKAGADGYVNFSNRYFKNTLTRHFNTIKLPDDHDVILAEAKTLAEQLKHSRGLTKTTGESFFGHDLKYMAERLVELYQDDKDEDVSEYDRQLPHLYSVYDNPSNSKIIDKSFFMYKNDEDRHINVFLPISPTLPQLTLDILTLFPNTTDLEPDSENYKTHIVTLHTLLLLLEACQIENVLLIDLSCNTYDERNEQGQMSVRAKRSARRNSLKKKLPVRKRSWTPYRNLKRLLSTAKKPKNTSKTGGGKTQRRRRTRNRFTRRNRLTKKRVHARRHTFRSMRRKANATKRTHKR